LFPNGSKYVAAGPKSCGMNFSVSWPKKLEIPQEDYITSQICKEKLLHIVWQLCSVIFLQSGAALSTQNKSEVRNLVRLYIYRHAKKHYGLFDPKNVPNNQKSNHKEREKGSCLTRQCEHYNMHCIVQHTTRAQFFFEMNVFDLFRKD
jgi:hypothetical protein